MEPKASFPSQMSALDREEEKGLFNYRHMQKADDIITLLEAYLPESKIERKFVEEVRELLRVHPENFYARNLFSKGHLTASAWITTPEHDAVALVFHRKLQRWLQPGGHIEAADLSVQEAARREGKEELGLDHLQLKSPHLLDIDVHPIPALKNELAHLHYDLRFWFSLPRQALKAQESEVEQVAWFSREAFEALEPSESMMRMARKIWG